MASAKRDGPHRPGKGNPIAVGWKMAMFATLERIADGLVKMHGPNVEVVVHDFADPQHSIIAIKGNVTSRNVGGSVTEIGLKVIAQGDGATDQVDYVTRARNGRVLRSSTFVLRDPGMHVFGALCVNVDVTDYRSAAQLLGELGAVPHAPPVEVHFTDDIHEVLQSLLNGGSQPPFDRTTTDGRRRLVAALVEKGYFAARGSVPILADFLGVTRATVYGYLSEAKVEPAPKARNVRSRVVAPQESGQ